GEVRAAARALRAVALEVVDRRRLERRRRSHEALRGRDHEQVTPREVDRGRAELVRDRETRLLRERGTQRVGGEQVLHRVEDGLVVLLGRGTQPVREPERQLLRSELILHRDCRGRDGGGLELVALEVVEGRRGRRPHGGRRRGGRCRGRRGRRTARKN